MRTRIFWVAAVAAALAWMVMPAGAQEYNWASLTITNDVKVSSTETVNSILYVGKQKDVAVQLKFEMDGTDTGNQTITFQRSVDGSNWETLAAKKTVVVIAATSGTASITVTNVPTHGAGFIRLATWQNGGSSQNTTNITVRYGIKIGAP